MIDEKPEQAPATDEAVPPIDFTTFVLSLSTSAVAHLEEAKANPSASVAALAIARQTVDLLALLEQKTAGNLTGEEERLLGQVVYELRMLYVAHVRG